MSDSSKHLAPSDALRQAHGIPKGHHLTGHKIVVEGFYFTFDKKSGDKIRKAYREEFTLRAREHKAAPQGALGHILSDKQLAERLSAKDPEFRAIQTHTITAHENLHSLAPGQPAAPSIVPPVVPPVVAPSIVPPVVAPPAPQAELAPEPIVPPEETEPVEENLPQ